MWRVVDRLMPRILFITKSPPFPTTIGGNQRSNLIYRALMRHGDVDLLLLQEPADLPGSHIERLRQSFGLMGCIPPAPRGSEALWRWVRPLGPALVDRAAHHLGRRRSDYCRDLRVAAARERLAAERRYEFIVVMELRMAHKAGLTRGVPHIVDLIDIDIDYYQSRLVRKNRPAFERLLLRRHVAQLERLLPDLLASHEHFWVVNPADVERSGLAGAHHLPNIPFEDGSRRAVPLQPVDSRRILFLGTFYHAPNVEGVRQFVSHVWPRIRAEVPDAELTIAGSGWDPLRPAMAARMGGVRIQGEVPSVEAVYAQSAFVVAPIYSGAGTCLKVIEALAFGRTLALTRYAQRGYEDVVRDGETALVCDSDATLSEACVRLLKDSALRDTLAVAGSRDVLARYNFGRFQSVVDETVAAVRKRAG
ncbi:MAG: glycosyltransferase [Kiritimatiellae bacterium]|nr:glycosyltransferase [Kiritimatiellia bacterium]